MQSSKQTYGQCGWLKKMYIYICKAACEASIGHITCALLVEAACRNCSIFLSCTEIHAACVLAPPNGQ